MMKDRIVNLIQTKPKHFSKIVKNNAELLAWVMANTLITSDNLAEHIYSAIQQQTNICKNGKVKKFRSINEGFAGCGKAAQCLCVRESVSLNVSAAKALDSESKKNEINAKRSATNLKKYGCSNTAQTEYAKQRHKDWYADPTKVSAVLDKVRKTNLERYGVENCKSTPEVEEKIIATCLARYGVTNVAQIPSTKAKLRARTAEYKLEGRLLSKGYDKVSAYVRREFAVELITPVNEYNGIASAQRLAFKCVNCNHRFVSKLYYGRGVKCEVCNPTVSKFVSNEEQEVFNYITEELGIAGSQSNKKIIAPYELDMVFPDFKIAIEYCGLYWHSEYSSGKDKKYHANKMKLANLAGYRLITIFSDEWNLRKDVVKSKLANIFKKTSTRYYARKLTVKEVAAADSKLFQDKHHLQGASSSKLSIGLYNDSVLVALMTFSNVRTALNSKGTASEYELVRFVTDGSSVVGGASKLLKYFIKKYSPTKIVSYADTRWSEGNVYKLLGFTELATTIGYWYVEGYKTRHHRYNFRKAALVEAGNNAELTEWEIMQNLGYDRIWDCGHIKFEMIL